ncbi:MAG: 50S ribosomal protein L18 [Candidatus Pacearchaeota archaeon]|nr:50S ribosomal protein L18 [Candidatus Pacearchaeota archaeon]
MKTLKRRRKEGKTDYLKRIKLLKNKCPRVIFRKTNKYILAQYVTSKEAQDKVEIGLTSKALIKYGWPNEMSGSLKSIPAAYLTGLLIGKEIIKNKLKTPIADFGMVRAIRKNRAYAFLNGIIESGIKIKCDEECFPDKDRISGKHMKKDFSQKFNEIKSKIEKN